MVAALVWVACLACGLLVLLLVVCLGFVVVLCFVLVFCALGCCVLIVVVICLFDVCGVCMCLLYYCCSRFRWFWFGLIISSICCLSLL